MFSNSTSFFSVLGVSIGVACLVASMAVVSGYESTLKKALVDYAGHLNIVKRGSGISKNEKVIGQLKKSLSEYVAHTPFVQTEGMIAHKGKISGVLVEGLDPDSVETVLSLKTRVLEGQFQLIDEGDYPTAVIGKDIAKNFRLNVGDVFTLVRPLSSKKNSERLYSKVKKIKVSGIIDLGKVDYNKRLVLVNLKLAQKIKPLQDAYSGLRVKLRRNPERNIDEVASLLEGELGYPYVVRSWREINRNLLEAVRLEKPVIFFVVMIILIAACFNICSHLFVRVLGQYRTVSILRTLGMSRKWIVLLFSLQGVILGAVGAIGGVILGSLISVGFGVAQEVWGITPGEAYKLASFTAEMRWGDITWICIVTLVVCFLSTLPPALRGSKISPVEGLRYE